MGELFAGQLLWIMRDVRPPRVNDVEKKKPCCPFSSLTHASKSCDRSERLSCWTCNAAAFLKVWCICKEQSALEVADVCCVNGIAAAAPPRGAGLQTLIYSAWKRHGCVLR